MLEKIVRPLQDTLFKGVWLLLSTGLGSCLQREGSAAVPNGKCLISSRIMSGHLGIWEPNFNLLDYLLYRHLEEVVCTGWRQFGRFEGEYCKSRVTNTIGNNFWIHWKLALETLRVCGRKWELFWIIFYFSHKYNLRLPQCKNYMNFGSLLFKKYKFENVSELMDILDILQLWPMNLRICRKKFTRRSWRCYQPVIVPPFKI